jgi:hypothetical protein
MSKAQADKVKVLQALKQARACILAAAAMLPVDRRTEVFLGIWTIRDLLAHLIGWDVTNVEAAQELLEGHRPRFFERYDPGWRTYNSELVARYRLDDWAALLASVEASHQDLLAFLQALPAEDLSRDRGLRAGRAKLTIAYLLRAEARDEWVHCAQVEAFARQTSSWDPEGGDGDDRS